MSKESKELSPFTGKVRVRACGVLRNGDSILFAKHEGIGPNGHLWAPPGGGVDFGDSIEKTIIKEFKEETHLDIEVGPFLFANEHIDRKHHAIELFFSVERKSGDLKLGYDPELPKEQQILSDLKFLTLDDIRKLPTGTIHKAFQAANAKGKIRELQGFITFND